jgi:OPA family glycerol-3-phosphate transporter-like MFS transporter
MLPLLLVFPAVRYTPKGMLWLDMALFALIGFFVYTPVLFSGVVSLDLTTKKAVGTAAGFVGMFGYIGRFIQGKGLGWIAQRYGWEPALWAVLGCTVIAILLLALLWNVRPRG